MESKKIDVNFMATFIEGALETLKIQCSLPPKAHKPYFKDVSKTSVVDIAAVVGITSNNFTGSVAICFPEKVFLGIMEKMLGESFNSISKELEDGASELMNIIFGHAKRVLNEKGYNIEKAIPTIIRGKSISVAHLTYNPTIILPFEVEFGVFYMEIATQN